MSVPHRAAVVVLLVLSACHAWAGSLGAQTTLRYKFKAGDDYAYVMQSTTKSTTVAGDKTLTEVNKQTIDMTWHVDKVDSKGTATVQVRFDRAKLSLQMGKDTVEVSSDSKDTPDKDPGKQMAVVVKALAKVTGTFTITSMGEIQNVFMPEAVIKEIKAMPGAEQVNWNEDTLRSTLKDNTLGLPFEAIAKGKSFKSPVEGQSPYGKISGEMEYIYEGPIQREGRTLERIVMKPRLKITPDPKAQFPVTIKRYDADGSAAIDNVQGRLMEMVSSTRVEVQTEVMGKMFTQKTDVDNALKRVK
jgi:hypothetical protein